MRWSEWGHPPEPEDVAWWNRMTESEAGRECLPITWVALDQTGTPIGAVGLAPFDPEELHDRSPWVIGMIVARSHRGAGIGTQLLVALEAWAMENGYRQLWVATENAARFYQRCGWHAADSIKRPWGEPCQILTRRLPV